MSGPVWTNGVHQANVELVYTHYGQALDPSQTCFDVCCWRCLTLAVRIDTEVV